MSAIRRDLTIEQGVTWSHVFSPLDAAGAARTLTGGTADMQIRSGPYGAVWAEPTLVVATNTVTASLTAAQTAAMDFDEAAYDLEIVLSGVTYRLFEGRVRFSLGLTT